MEFLLSVLTVIFIALMLAAAVTFGFALFVWFLLVAAVVTAGVLLRQWWYRWQFLQAEKKQSVIEVEYEDISSDE